jgi:hypothetical protein
MLIGYGNRVPEGYIMGPMMERQGKPHRRELKPTSQGEKGTENQRKIPPCPIKKRSPSLKDRKGCQVKDDVLGNPSCCGLLVLRRRAQVPSRGKTCPFCLIEKRLKSTHLPDRQGLPSVCSWDGLVVYSSSQWSRGLLMCSHQREQKQSLA